jgi:hypothetical protein
MLFVKATHPLSFLPCSPLKLLSFLLFTLPIKIDERSWKNNKKLVNSPHHIHIPSSKADSFKNRSLDQITLFVSIFSSVDLPK